MEQLKTYNCKNCGGELDYSKAVNGVLYCEFCGSVYTVPKSDSKAISYLDKGMAYLDTCEFDKSYTMYQKASEIDPKEPEAYFGMALATAKVQYLKDHVNNRMQPICHDVKEKSFLQDENLKMAFKLATAEQKKEYTAKANEIDSIRRQFYEFKKSGLNYDCFICVKVTEKSDTDLDKKRFTEDNTMALKIYHWLKEAGYTPFYSEEEIKNRTGADYEALILYALHSAQSMILVCTDEKYLQESPWVKNEYTRYLNLLGQEEKQLNSLTIVFKDRDNVIEKLPGYNSKIQGVPFYSPEAMNDIIKFVDRFAIKSAPEITRKEYGKTSYAKKNVIKQGVAKRQLTSVGKGTITVSDKAKLNLAEDFLKRGDYDNTIRFCNNLIAENPSNSEAYWMTFLAENRCKNDNEILESAPKIEDFSNFEKALASVSTEKRKNQMYGVLFERIKRYNHLDEYQEYIELPDSSEANIAALTDEMFEKALLFGGQEKVFNTIIKTVSNTDKYIDMTMRFAKVLDERKATEYYKKRVLKIDEGNHEALWLVFRSEHNYRDDDIFTYCANTQNHSIVEEQLFSYGYNEFALKALFNICLKRVNEKPKDACKFFDLLLSLIPKRQEKMYIASLNKVIDLLLKAQKPELVGRYNDLLLAADKFDHNAYFTRCLINHGLFNPLGLIRYVDNLLSDEDYFAAVNTYTEKYPDKNNLYLDLFYAIQKLKLPYAPVCKDYLIDNYPMEIDDLMKGNFKKGETLLVEQAKSICAETLSKYHCHQFEDVYSLRQDVSQDPDWKLAYDFATSGNDNKLASQIKQVIDTQAKACQNNQKADELAEKKRRQEQKNKRVFVSTVAFTVVFALAVITTLILALVGVHPFGEFGLVLFSVNANLLFAVGIAVICVMAILLILAVSVGSKKKGKLYVTALVLICALTVGYFGAGICQWGLAKQEKSATYIGDGYVLKLVSEYGESYTIEECAGNSKKVVLPSTYNGKPIDEIGNYAFENCSKLESVVVPDSVKRIGYAAFKGCNNLESITLPFIGENENAPSESQYFGYIFGGNKFTAEAYSKNRDSVPSSLKTVIINGEISSIGNEVFEGCISLTNIYIPNSVTSIGYGAFYGCVNLTSIEIPSAVTSIGYNAFYNCGNIRKATLPTTAISSIPKDKLESVVINGGTSISDSAFRDCSSLRSIEIPDSVRSIGDRAFEGCSSLKSIEIPDSVSSIGYRAFSSCSSLTSIEIPSSVTYMGSIVFWDCHNITTATVPTTAISSIPMDRLESVVINGGTSINNNAFRDCSRLASIKIPSSVTSIGNDAFRGCSRLRSIDIPRSVMSIGDRAFYDCDNLERIFIPDNGIYVGWYAFYHCSRLTAYCESTSQPSAWADWNPDNCPVIWGYKK